MLPVLSLHAFPGRWRESYGDLGVSFNGDADCVQLSTGARCHYAVNSSRQEEVDLFVRARVYFHMVPRCVHFRTGRILGRQPDDEYFAEGVATVTGAVEPGGSLREPGVVITPVTPETMGVCQAAAAVVVWGTPWIQGWAIHAYDVDDEAFPLAWELSFVARLVRG